MILGHTASPLLLTFDFRRILFQNQRCIGSLLTNQSVLCHRPIALEHSSMSEYSSPGRFHASEKDRETSRLRRLGTTTEYSNFSTGEVGRLKSSVATISLSENAKWPKRLGLHAQCVYYWNFYQSTYSVRFFLRFPNMFGQRLLAFETTMRFHTLSWNLSRFLSLSLGTPLIVDCLSPLMSACSKGDLNTARDLIESREVNLSDRRGSCSCKVWECRSHEGETALFVS